MDEYWNYALFNVFSICMFEASTAFARLKNLSTLRSMRNKEITVQVSTHAREAAGRPLSRTMHAVVSSTRVKQSPVCCDAMCSTHGVQR
jgi:hypothetical protein